MYGRLILFYDLECRQARHTLQKCTQGTIVFFFLKCTTVFIINEASLIARLSEYNQFITMSIQMMTAL